MEAFFNGRSKQGRRLGHHIKSSSLEEPLVPMGINGSPCADDANLPARESGLYGVNHRVHDIDDRNGFTGLRTNGVQRIARRRIARNDYGFTPQAHQLTGDLRGITTDESRTLLPVRQVSGITIIENGMFGQGFSHCPCDGQASDARVKNPNGSHACAKAFLHAQLGPYQGPHVLTTGVDRGA